MYSLLIIEDEVIIRKALINDVDWNSIECQIIGDTDNGDDAITIINKLSPDIVISDIKIYGKSGIEVCNFIHENIPKIKCILLTGYGDLEYAKSAIKYGVSDFILKPSSPSELLESVEKITVEICAERRREEEFALLQKRVESEIPKLREKFFIELSNGVIADYNELKQNLEFLKIDISKFYVLVLEIDDYSSFKNKYNEIEIQANKLAIRHICENVLDNYYGGYFIEKEANLFIVIVKYQNEVDIASISDKIQKEIYEFNRITVSFGISLISDDITKLSLFVEQALYALNYRFYVGDSSIIYFGDISKVKYKEHVDYSKYFMMISNSVIIGNLDEAFKYLEILKASVLKSGIVNENYHRAILMGLIVKIQTDLEIKNLNINDILDSDIYIDLSETCSFYDSYNIVKDIIESIIKYIVNQNKNQNIAVITQIENFLNENYSKHITLEDLGKVVYMNPKYICRLIKKEKGENFIDILNKIRIDKAKEMMEDIKYKTYEVSEMVGINDYRYFSQLFKKYVGLTPTEYRNNAPNR